MALTDLSYNVVASMHIAAIVRAKLQRCSFDSMRITAQPQCCSLNDTDTFDHHPPTTVCTNKLEANSEIRRSLAGLPKHLTGGRAAIYLRISGNNPNGIEK